MAVVARQTTTTTIFGTGWPPAGSSTLSSGLEQVIAIQVTAAAAATEIIGLEAGIGSLIQVTVTAGAATGIGLEAAAGGLGTAQTLTLGGVSTPVHVNPATQRAQPPHSPTRRDDSRDGGTALRATHACLNDLASEGSAVLVVVCTANDFRNYSPFTSLSNPPPFFFPLFRFGIKTVDKIRDKVTGETITPKSVECTSCALRLVGAGLVKRLKL
mmetsp:Transcript_189/g.603  ORF Transcript_189/g.603 Transcript_189/m.603 type:complete len:214 (-) Transcript_189:933-1574(-)